MRTIWKFPLEIKDEQIIQMPKGSQCLSVPQFQRDVLCIWALVDPENELKDVKFHICGTGNPIPKNLDQWSFCGTVQAGAFVWHVFIE